MNFNDNLIFKCYTFASKLLHWQ